MINKTKTILISILIILIFTLGVNAQPQFTLIYVVVKLPPDIESPQLDAGEIVFQQVS